MRRKYIEKCGGSTHKASSSQQDSQVPSSLAEYFATPGSLFDQLPNITKITKAKVIPSYSGIKCAATLLPTVEVRSTNTTGLEVLMGSLDRLVRCVTVFWKVEDFCREARSLKNAVKATGVMARAATTEMMYSMVMKQRGS